MDALIAQGARAVSRDRLGEKLAVTEGLLYRRGNFNGTFDQLILDALMAEKDARDRLLARVPLGHDAAARARRSRCEHLMDQTAITYPYATVNEMTGETIKTILEDVCDNLFNPDPYYQQGGDMVRVGGLRYAIDPKATMGRRIIAHALDGKPIEAAKKYKVAGWAPVAEGREGGRRRADLGRDGALPAGEEDDRAARAQPAAIEGATGNPGMADTAELGMAGADELATPCASAPAHNHVMRSRITSPSPARTSACPPARRPSGRGNDERLVGDDFAVDLEAALRDQAQRFGRRLDDARLLRELRDRQAGAAVASVTSGMSSGQRAVAEPRLEFGQRVPAAACEWKRATISCASTTLASRGLRPSAHSRFSLAISSSGRNDSSS